MMEVGANKKEEDDDEEEEEMKKNVRIFFSL